MSRNCVFVVVLAFGSLDAAARPTLSGPELIHDSNNGLLKIHYTLEGIDALSSTEDVEPANGIPDPLDDIELGMTRVWDEFVLGDGWPAVPGDEGRGGDDRLDVYVRDIAIYGYARYEAIASGHTAYFEVDHEASSTGHLSLQSIAGHELHHGLQATVGTGLGSWVYEATSTWVQYTIFTGNVVMDVARQVLWVLRLEDAALAFDTTGNRFEYAGMTWIQFLMQHASSRYALLDLWRDMASNGGWEAGHRAAIGRFGFASLEEAVARFHEWNLFACYRDDRHHWDADALPCEFESGVPVRVLPDLPASTTTIETGRFGATYLQVTPDCSSQTLTVDVDATVPHAAAIVRVRAAGGPLVERFMREAGPWSAPIDGWNDAQRVIVVLVNVDETPARFDIGAHAAGTYAPAADAQGASGLTIGPQPQHALAPGESLQLTSAGTFFSCADGLDVSSSVTWRSSNPSVASVEAGRVVAVSSGETILTATNDEVVSNEVIVRVELAPREGPAFGCSDSTTGRGWSVPAALLALLLASRRRR